MTTDYRYRKYGSEYSIQRLWVEDGRSEWQHMYYVGSLKDAKNEVKLLKAEM